MRAAKSWKLAVCAAAITAIASSAALAGVFDDEFAREQLKKTQADVADFREQSSARFERLEAALKMQVELANQIEGLRAELAKLRGQLEVSSYEIETSQKRQRDFYVDLDGRLRKIEGTVGELATKAAEPPPPPSKPKVDPTVETRAYEEGLNLFKSGKYKESQAAFESFAKEFPASTLVSSAYFWLGNSLYALRDCKRAIEAHNQVITQFPESSKAPDAMLAVATCQQELNDAKSARSTLEALIGKYAQAPAADTARKTLEALNKQAKQAEAQPAAKQSKRK
jgi:tol-pal system protein YbgF